MCRIFSGQDPDLYKAVTRSVRLNGYCTSIRLEALFWSILDEIAAREKMTTPRFIGTLYDEVLERRGVVGNFASLLRVTCAVHMSGTPLPRDGLPVSAGRDASARVAAPA